MGFSISNNPHSHKRKSTSMIMLTVSLSMLPGIAALFYFFGWGVLLQIALACASALIAEILVAILRRRPLFSYIRDNSALLTGILIGISIPPMASWWLPVIGASFAIIIAKHLYGGLGQNPFNPCMIGYVVLLISFPVQMTNWLPPSSLMSQPLSMMDAISTIFTGFTSEGYSAYQLRDDIDGVSMATPLDTMKTAFSAGLTASDAFQYPIFSTFLGHGWGWVNLAFMFSGLLLLKLKIMHWHIPVAFLSTLFVLSVIGYLFSPDTVISPLLHLFSGATMLGAFFIATDPVTAPSSPKGRLIFGGLIATLVYVIRTFGGFPEGMAFAVLLANLCVPLIDYYNKPTIYGMKDGKC